MLTREAGGMSQSHFDCRTLAKCSARQIWSGSGGPLGYQWSWAGSPKKKLVALFLADDFAGHTHSY